MKHTSYTAPTTIIVRIRTERIIADSDPQVSVNRDATPVSGSSLDAKSQGSYNVWKDDWN
ncbi:MAG: hypothetical protein J5486_11515 [Bacteroidaceae bacterium]|nr:hypothetical protein [Bacteroidaceae bacterium]